MLRKLSLTHWIFISIGLAIIVGLLAPAGQGKTLVMSVSEPLGTLFLRLLKMVVVPLIFSSITVGVLGLGNSKNLGRLGGKTIAYYLTTSTFAILIGLALVNAVNPGGDLNLDQDPSALQRVEEASGPGGEQPLAVGDSGGVWGFLMRMIPDNPVAAMVEGDMLAVIFFSVLLGLFLSQLPERQRTLMTDLFQSLFDAMMLMTRFVILLAPVGIFGLVAFQVAKESADPERFLLLFAAVTKFFLVVVCGLSLHAFVVLPLLLRVLGGIRNPYRHLKAMGKALLTAFSTASSNATLPVTMECVEENSGVSNKMTSFVLPLGATINMDGTALYECVVVVFIAQAFNFDLSFGAQVVVVVTALLTSVGVAGVPMASLVAIVIILRTVHMEDYLVGIGLVMVTDRILDMMRTAVNVWSDSCGAVIIARSEGERTKLLD